MPEKKISTNTFNWRVLGALYTNYFHFYSLYRDYRLEEITMGGVTVNVLDILNDIKSLPNDQARTIYLTCIEQFSDAEAAIEMGVNKWDNTIGHYRRRGLQALAKRYCPALSEDEEETLCLCGCSRETQDGKDFLTGHSAKLKASLVKDCNSEDEAVRLDAIDHMKFLCWGKFIPKEKIV